MPGMMGNMPGQASPMAGGQKPLQFTSNTPGGGAQIAGYNNALSSLQNSLNANNNTTSSQMGQLGQQLQNNQASIGQNLTNRGLGNTTVMNTMQQAPLQTYNMGASQVQNQQAMRQMMGYQQLANMQAQGGQAISQMQQPYAQTQFTQNLMRAMQPANVGYAGYGGMQGSPYASGNTGYGGGGQAQAFGPGFGSNDMAPTGVMNQLAFLNGAGGSDSSDNG